MMEKESREYYPYSPDSGCDDLRRRWRLIRRFRSNNRRSIASLRPHQKSAHKKNWSGRRDSNPRLRFFCHRSLIRMLLRGVIQHDGFLDLLGGMGGYWGGFEKAGAVMFSPMFSLVQSRQFIYASVKVADLFFEE